MQDIIGLAAFGTDFNMVVTGSHPLPSIIQSRLKFVSFVSKWDNASFPKKSH
jgi:hypothetical protein